MIDIQKKKIENHCNYLTPTKSTTLKRLPTHSYNNFYQNQKQNLLNKFKDCNSNNIMQIKVNNNNNYCLNTQQKVMRKNSLLLPLLNKKNSNCTINNEINCFRRQHRKSVDQKKSNISISQMNSNINININNNNKENNIIVEQKENNTNENFENCEDKEIKTIYKSKVNSCKQVRTKKI